MKTRGNAVILVWSVVAPGIHFLYIYLGSQSLLWKEQLTKSSLVAGLPLCTLCNAHLCFKEKQLTNSGPRVGGRYTPYKLRNPTSVTKSCSSHSPWPLGWWKSLYCMGICFHLYCRKMQLAMSWTSWVVQWPRPPENGCGGVVYHGTTSTVYCMIRNPISVLEKCSLQCPGPWKMQVTKYCTLWW